MGEVKLARSVFGSAIFYHSVLVHCDSHNLRGYIQTTSGYGLCF